METWLEVPQKFSELNQQAKILLKEVLRAGELVLVLKEKKIFADVEIDKSDFRGRFWIIKSGQISCLRQNQLLCVFNEGDILGLEAHHQLDGIRLRAQFPVEIQEVATDVFYDRLRTHPKAFDFWSQYQSIQLSIMALMLSSSMKGEFDPTTFLRTYEPGAMILKEGDPSHEVLTLMEGYADVFVKTVKVGEIQPDQLFGVMASLTNKPRSATVIAASHCLVIAMPKEHFVEFIKSRPATVLKMVQDMSETISNLNERVVETQLRKKLGS